MCAAFYYEKNESNFMINSSLNEPCSLSSLPFGFDRRHYKKDSRFVNDLYTLTYDDHESLDSVRLFSSFANQVSVHFTNEINWGNYFFFVFREILSLVSLCVSSWFEFLVFEQNNCSRSKVNVWSVRNVIFFSSFRKFCFHLIKFELKTANS